jgi:eukaryotic-like serine/threonine-protein kinase
MSSNPSASPLVPGLLLDRYELLAPVAQGGMAQVWVARLQGKLGFERMFAIKTMIAEHAVEQRFVNMFLDEARIISLIRHPNVAQVLDLGQHAEVLYLVLEWIDGDSMASLRRLIHGRGLKLPLNVVLKVVAESCAGLHAAHELKNASGESLNVVHRDVSPSNILVSPSGEIKVIDFGVAKAVDRISEETAQGVIKGKVAYMSPEQALGKAVDRRADIWSLGVTLYHLLAGRTPYEGDNQIQTLHKVVQGLPPEPIRGAPPEVSEIAYTALSYSPDGRFATADEMQRVVETAMNNLCGPTTQADIAAYVSDKLAERIARRKRVIARALEAADQRRQLHAEFENAIEQSSSSMYSVHELHTPSSMAAYQPSPMSDPDGVDALLAGNGHEIAAPAPRPAAGAPPSTFPPSAPASDPDDSLPDGPNDPLPSWQPPPGAVGPLPPKPRAPTSEPSAPLSSAPPPPIPPAPAVPRFAPSPPPSPPPAPPEPEPKLQPKPVIAVAPPPPVVSEAVDAPPRPQLGTLLEMKKFGTRRRGPMIAIGFTAALLFLGYAAYLAWDRVSSEQDLLPAPSATP